MKPTAVSRSTSARLTDLCLATKRLGQCFALVCLAALFTVSMFGAEADANRATPQGQLSLYEVAVTTYPAPEIGFHAEAPYTAHVLTDGTNFISTGPGNLVVFKLPNCEGRGVGGVLSIRPAAAPDESTIHSPDWHVDPSWFLCSSHLVQHLSTGEPDAVRMVSEKAGLPQAIASSELQETLETSRSWVVVSVRSHTLPPFLRWKLAPRGSASAPRTMRLEASLDSFGEGTSAVCEWKITRTSVHNGSMPSVEQLAKGPLSAYPPLTKLQFKKVLDFRQSSFLSGKPLATVSQTLSSSAGTAGWLRHWPLLIGAGFTAFWILGWLSRPARH